MFMCFFLAKCLSLITLLQGIIQKEINFYQEVAPEHRLQENVSTLIPFYIFHKQQIVSHQTKMPEKGTDLIF